MKRDRTVVLIETALLLLFGGVGLAGGIDLYVRRDPHTLYDVLGPGFYVVILSIGMLAVGLFHIISHYKNPPVLEKLNLDKEMRIRLWGTIANLVVYIAIISVTGYLVSTVVFFLVEFRILGIKFWPNSIILTGVATATYYLVFIEYCRMVFPRGMWIFFHLSP